MSWVKKRGQPSPAPPPQVQMYNPNQHSNQENQWQQQSQDNWYNQPPKQDTRNQYWQQPYQQPYTQNSQQYGHYPEYYQNNTPYQQQSFENVQYNQQYNSQYSAQPQQTDGEGWSSNWGWGDEDNSNVQTTVNATADSFTNDTTWNWSLEENNASKPLKPPTKPELELEVAKQIPPIERLTSRAKLDTPQWSVESQVSQESSDDVLQTSESDKSRMLSRSSTISHSPISGHDLPPTDNVQEANHFENKEILLQTRPEPTPPPPSIPHDDSKSNPYKRNPQKPSSKFNATPNFHPQMVNLETLPDNSEQPDPIPPAAVRKVSKPPSWPENNEAPINDRNQYLETAQLSDVDVNNYNRLSEGPSQDNDTLPPPGLRRMIPGRMEQQENNQGSGEDPPPTFSRMIPGQLESTPVAAEPPEGLRRMVPGESSSPENARRADDSEPEFPEVVHPPRSATIGADTPPVGAAKRRDSGEGQIRDDDVGGLTNAVRNLTVGDHGADEGGSNERQESSESEPETRPKSPVDRRERRYKDEGRERERGRGRYTPEDYREKKYDRRRYKDRRYEEDTDYYSDKERDMRHRDDRKYGSLRKEKEREKGRRREDRRGDDRREYGRDARKSDYYYSRYEEDYENESRSRASSRSDSIHDPYRERPRGHERERRDKRYREKERQRRHRMDPFNPYAQGYNYDLYSQYYQQYHYYENLRKTNPQAYAQLYRKYYQGETPYGGEDRASVHSGRSSANDELAKDRYTRQSYYSQTSLPHLGGYYRGSQTHSISGQYGLDDSSFVRALDQTDNSLNLEDQTINAQRLTPAKFATAHVKASIASGKLVKVLPHYPLDGQPAVVELCKLEALLSNDEDYQELKRFPGPLVKGATHKKTIIEYCENKIRSAYYDSDINDKESYVLMWELLILLIRQNGMVVGADIAELLLKHRQQILPSAEGQRPSSVVSSVASGVEPTSEAESSPALKEEEVTNKFREYLLYGSGKEALEWAMKNGLWGHALFLASKLDKRTYANVLMRFANGLAMNDPLQTLYQLLSGKTPAAVTCVADEKWGDWRPHLAMILSNSTQRPDLNCKAITVLGDTLMGRGSLYAAQFCYLMAEVGFGQYGSDDSKLVLLGANHNQPFSHFATTEAIHMTEIYEYARSLNDSDFALANFQRYKYLLSTRLADVGLLEKALSYLEKIAGFIVKNPGAVDGDLVEEVSVLADRLKYYDPVGDGDEEGDLDTSRPDNSWLKELRRVQNDYSMGLITNSGQGIESASNVLEETAYGQTQDVWQQQQTYDYQQQWNQQPIEQPPEQPQEGYSPAQYQDQQQYWQGQQQWNPDQSATAYQEPVEQHSYYGSINQTEQEQVEKATLEVSTCLTSSLKQSTLRKRLTTHSPTKRPQLKSLDSMTDAKNRGSGSFGKKTKVYPFKNRSAEDFASSRDSSDGEVFYKNEEKSALICYKDSNKVIAIKSDSKLTKYNTFDMKFNDKKGIIKYKSLDEPSTVVKYYDSQSNVAISSQDYSSDFKLSRFDRKCRKQDIITETVDAWAKRNSSNMFSNIRNSIFKSNRPNKEIIYKPLVFGGTFPIDAPLGKREKLPPTVPCKETKQPPLRFREYGPPRTFDIDRPI